MPSTGIAETFDVVGPAESGYLSRLTDFELRAAPAVPLARLLERPTVSIYALDDATRRVVLVETPADVDLGRAPFYYVAQRQTATRVYTLPYDVFATLASDRPDPSPVLIYSVGRCGSTLLCHALRGYSDAQTLSEPDIFNHTTGIREPDRSRDAEIVALLRGWARFTFRSGSSRSVVVKFASYSIHIADLIARTMPGARCLFLYRDLPGWIRSIGRMQGLRRPDAPTRADQILTTDLTYGTYRRDRFNPALRAVDRPVTLLEASVLNWTSAMGSYSARHDDGRVPTALGYDALVGEPAAALGAAAGACGLPLVSEPAGLAAFECDSQAGTTLSREALAADRVGELTAADVRHALDFAARHGFAEDACARLPGRLLS
ncbi:MAG: hypothetical protein ACR2F6_15660 [Mycobacteriales bacterium]